MSDFMKNMVNTLFFSNSAACDTFRASSYTWMRPDDDCATASVNRRRNAVRMKLIRRHKKAGNRMLPDKPAARSSSFGKMDFEEIYRGFVRPVYAFVAYRIDSRSDAEDVTATTFEKALRASARFDPA